MAKLEPYRLKHPIDYREGEEQLTLSVVELRRATAKDLLLIDQYQHQPMKLVLEMIEQLSGLPGLLVGKLDAEDVGPLGERAFSNVEGGPRIGENV